MRFGLPLAIAISALSFPASAAGAQPAAGKKAYLGVSLADLTAIEGP